MPREVTEAGQAAAGGGGAVVDGVGEGVGKVKGAVGGLWK